MKRHRLRILFVLILGLSAVAIALVGLRMLGAAMPVAQAETDNVHTVCKAGPPECDFSVIQEAVDAASDGDVIKVSAGTYGNINARVPPPGYLNALGTETVRQVVFVVKDVTIRGGYPPTNDFSGPPDPDAYPTVLDAQSEGRGIFVGGMITTTIEGLRVTNGNAFDLGGDFLGRDAGGGVFIMDAAAVLNQTSVENSRAYSYECSPIICWQGGRGGGLYVGNGTVTLTRNLIAGNGSNRGAGLYSYHSNITLIENTVQDNSAHGVLHDGARCGGLLLDSSQASIMGNTVTENWGDFDAGGICLYGGTITLTGNRVSFNENGGLYIGGESNTTLAANVISNHSTGLRVRSSNVSMTNNIMVNNQWHGLDIGSSSTRLWHNTIVGSSNMTDNSSGIDIYDSTAELVNTILTSYMVGINVATDSTATLEATLWGGEGWENGADWLGAGNISTGTINIWADPGFMDPDAGDYHIGFSSAARDRGVDAGVTTDIDGDARPMFSGFDIGADEFLEPPWRSYLPLTLR